LKTKFAILFILAGGSLMMQSCHKTYTCKCTDPSGTNTYTTGQVKAMSKKRAEQRCSSSGCANGTI